jgi:N-methylhydantoinase A
MAYLVAVDIGGTFTDLVAFDRATNRVLYTKAPTTYGNFGDGIMECFGKVSLSPREAALVNHGTTLVINAIVQRNGARTALVTTAGFRDVLEIARGNRPDPFDLHYRRDEPLVPRELRFEVGERMDGRGEVVQPLDLGALTELAGKLRAAAVESVAIFFMHSFANPQHEVAAAELLRRLLPGVFVTYSTELTREWYEYERTSTVAANAYVGPSVSTYIRRIEADLAAGGFTGSLYMMGSNGGVLSTDRTCRQPIALVESGPVGGCIGAGAYARALGYDNVIAFDMGGTTAKCALVESGRFAVDSVYYAGGYKYGFPVKSPVVDIVEVGSGGGSIAWLDAQKRLHVGPQSAGSTPGPVCYGRGGTQPTVTDANLVLGRINAQNFLGGELSLDVAAARHAIEEHIARPLEYADDEGVVRMADGILSIATVVMAGALRRISVEHGHDPRDFVLFCYGGGGPLHGSALAHELSIPTVIIPPEPGTFSATGMLLADARLDDAITFAEPLAAETLDALEAAYATMERDMATALTAEFGAKTFRSERFAEMRYRGQRHNIKVPIAPGADAAAIRTAFERDYLRRYGHADADAPAEFQALHLSGFAELDGPEIARLPRASGGRAATTTRMVYFADAGGMLETAVYDRYALEPGATGAGPALLEEYGSTTLVWPGDRFTIGTLHEIRIDCTAEEREAV